VGLELEIGPDRDPCGVRPRDELSFRILRDGEPAVGVLMMALHRSSPGSPAKVRADAAGRFRFRFDRPGLWLVKGVEMKRVEGRTDVDWKSRWASLTFELGEGAP
jgi:uncharacterized GH25 family protein